MSVRRFMVPDFRGLRRQSGSPTSQRSFKPSDRKGFGGSKSSQQFPKQTDNTPVPQPKRKADHSFFELWTALPSWSPIIKKPDGWLTVINDSGKKVPLVLGSVISYYQRGIILGKRFGRLTNYLMVDVDRGSPFHPLNGTLDPILDAMESLGLCRYLLIRSSVSDGLHIYFPLSEPVSSWGLACAAHAALTMAGVTVAGGICELFPNKKAFNAEHNGHRLPLQNGSFILDDDFRCIGNHRAVFLQHWRHCAAGQDDVRLAELLAEKPVAVPKRIAVSSLPPIAWTGLGQSNEVMKQLVNYGDRMLGLKTIPRLGNWIKTVAPQLPGFDTFASRESKNDLTRRNWAYRWAKSHFKSVRQYRAQKSVDHNAMVAAEALERLKVALNKLTVTSKIGIRQLWQSLSAISKELFGVGFSWGLFQKHRKLILTKVDKLLTASVSRSSKEDKNSARPELAKPKDAEAKTGPKKRLPKLLTVRCVTSSHDKELSPSRTPSEQVSEQEVVGAEGTSELAMGASVRVQHPRSGLDGVQSRVTGKVTGADGRLLYRLEYRVNNEPVMLPRECLVAVAEKPRSSGTGDVIEATAQQLLQVLGKACPFVGPGLWRVKREELSPLAWRQLIRLIEEG